ncbi:universal stress protein [Bradyrhizobium sp. I1.7.5]|uniref:universal stress protein n=1 Tax=Bradyrhizobium sp. I1.7.5 TaxID=3156363 RepID=UPI00339691E1
MSIKRILVPLPGSAGLTGQIETALSAAKALVAHVQALFISEPPPVTRDLMATDLMATGMGRRTATVPVNWHAEERERTARDAREVFARACAVVGIPMLSASDEPGRPLAASWREAEGSYVEIAVQRAAAFDLMVAASASVMESLMAIAEQSLLRTRRPVLLAPARPQSDLTDSVMIAWDESPECWHAVSAAIPFMQLAKSVRVISVDRDGSNRQASQAQVLAYLRCHGIDATAQVVAPELRSVGDTLLAVGAEHEAGLLIMGAYSHSRLREMFLGGATRHILKNASVRPVLLAH